MSFIAWERHVPCRGFFRFFLFAFCLLRVLLRARESGYRDRGTHGGWMFSVVGEIDDMFKKPTLFNASRVLGFRYILPDVSVGRRYDQYLLPSFFGACSSGWLPLQNPM